MMACTWTEGLNLESAILFAVAAVPVLGFGQARVQILEAPIQRDCLGALRVKHVAR